MRRIAIFIAAGVLSAGFGASAKAAPGAISGHVTDPDGHPLDGICVRADVPDSQDWWGVHVVTDTSGAYTITGLAPGDYKVHFWDLRPACTTGFDFFLDQWFDGRTDPSSADLVNVADGATTSGIDATMPEPEAIVGVVTAASGQPIEGVCILAIPVFGGSGSAPVQTDANGYYVARVPSPGTYKVEFYDDGQLPCYLGQYVTQWYHDKPDQASADPVGVVAGHATYGIDAVMYEYPSISGHVQDEAGQPIAGLCIVANKAHVLNPPSLVPPFAQTDASGNYRMDIAVGDWVLQFYDGGTPCTATSKWQLQYFNGKYIFDEADIIHVARGAQVTGINVTMKPKQQQVQTPPPPPPPPPPVVNCRVPTVKGLTLSKAKRLLHKNHCGVGKVTRRPAKRRMVGRVLVSRPAARTVKPDGTKVALVVGKRRGH